MDTYATNNQRTRSDFFKSCKGFWLSTILAYILIEYLVIQLWGDLMITRILEFWEPIVDNLLFPNMGHGFYIDLYDFTVWAGPWGCAICGGLALLIYNYRLGDSHYDGDYTFIQYFGAVFWAVLGNFSWGVILFLANVVLFGVNWIFQFIIHVMAWIMIIIMIILVL